MRKPCFVYIFARDCDGYAGGPVKIGISSDPDARLRAVQTGCPHRIIKLCHVYAHDREVAKNIEALIHLELSDKRASGEWFNATPLEAVEALLICFREALEAIGFSKQQFYEFASAGTGLAEVMERYLSAKAAAAADMGRPQ